MARIAVSNSEASDACLGEKQAAWQNMNVIQPNCRMQFTADDVEFILSVLGQHAGDRDCLIRLLSDEEARDAILDDDALFQALLERRQCLPVSARFYFYIVTRQVLRRSGLDDRAVTDYVAEMLAEFSRTDRVHGPAPGAGQPFDYLVDMLAALQTADDHTTFLIRAHVGNSSLFMTGVFPDRIRFRTERRGAPSLRYYEELGRTSFRVASDHRLARKYAVADIFATLAERFETTRRALNDLSERVLSLGDLDIPVGALLDKPAGGI
jgi:hypothetical protein